MSSSKLNPPVVLVTGCSKGGIGYALCEEFASKGCKVYATARRIEAMEGFIDQSIERIKLDVTDDANVQEVVNTIIEREGRIDVLVNNAGVGCVGPLAEMPLERVTNTFETNVFSILRMVKAVFPFMAARKSGTIVNVGSIAGEFPTPWGGVYAATKASVRSISESLYIECKPFNVSVVHLSPGAVRSNIANNQAPKFSLAPNTIYKAWTDSILARITISQKMKAMPNGEFAKKVVKAVMSQSPPRYLSLGGASTIFKVFAWLPRGLVLWAMWNRLAGKSSKKAS